MKKNLLVRCITICLCLVCALGANQTPILQASIALEPAYPSRGEQGHLQPGMPAVVKTIVKNVGNEPNSEGDVLIRFTLPKALAALGNAALFETEKEPLPILQPGNETEIVFKTPQQLPCLVDFLKSDWSMHLYEAVARFGEKEFVIGSGTITFSAHYYMGPGKPLPAIVP